MALPLDFMRCITDMEMEDREEPIDTTPTKEE